MTISEVSEKYGLTAVTLRYYEKIGLIPPVTRNKSGVRDYQPEECGWVEFVKCMRSAGMPVETLLQYMALLREGEHTKPERMQLLVRQREALLEKRREMDETIRRLESKIAYYEDDGKEAGTPYQSGPKRACPGRWRANNNGADTIRQKNLEAGV